MEKGLRGEMGVRGIKGLRGLKGIGWIGIIGIIGIIGFPNFALGYADHLVISQVQLDGVAGTGGSEQDWIELYNPTSQAVDIGGWKLRKRTQSGSESSVKVISSNTTIPASGYFLWANSKDGFATALNADESSTSTIAKDNSIALLDKNDNIIDALAWGSGHVNPFIEDTAAVNPNEAVSLERLSQDTDNNLADFFSQASPHPRSCGSACTAEPSSDIPAPASSAPTPSSVYSSDVYITELLPNPDGSDLGEEWVEIYNAGDGEVWLADWVLDDGDGSNGIGLSAYTFPEGIILKGRSYLAVNLPEDAFVLNNVGGETVRLLWPDGHAVSEAGYEDDALEDRSFARVSDGSFEWVKQVTKGRANIFEPEGPVAPTVDVLGEHQIKIAEVFPNPAGTDSGKEWVKVINTGTAAVSLNNWILDDGDGQAKIGSNAYKISGVTVEPGETAVITVPAGNVAFNNSGLETVRLFNAGKVLIDFVNFEDAKEEAVLIKQADGSWIWNTPAPKPAAAKIVAKPAAASQAVFISPPAIKPAAPDEKIQEITQEIIPAVAGESIINNPEAQPLADYEEAGNGQIEFWTFASGLMAGIVISLAFCYIGYVLGKRK